MSRSSDQTITERLQ